jgi:acetylornithine deacetylase/succinyl-diaminopimelate desuccinylase-like protein
MNGIALFALALAAPAGSPDPLSQEAVAIYRELVEIDTTDSKGDNTRAAEAMAKRLKDAGFAEADVRVLVPYERKGNLVARLRGTGVRKPLLLLAHLDVVEARREDWTTDPFQFLEKDGFYYGRGSADDKAMAAIFTANLIRMKKEGYRPDRDLILALTADEEGGPHNGVDFLLKEHRPLIDAAYGLNEGGRGQIKDGKRIANVLQTSEKVYLSFHLEAKDSGGHSSVPRKGNPIYRLAAALSRLAAFSFPVRTTETTRLYFERLAASQAEPLASDMRALAKTPPDAAAATRVSETPLYNSMLRTTCVATRLEGGHADNALPQMARATVNCRMHPDDPADWVHKTLVEVVADAEVSVTPLGSAKPSPPSPLSPEFLGAVEELTKSMWPGVPVLPTLSTGATDSLYLRSAGIPMYGVSGLFGDIDDVRAHGKDERVLTSSFEESREFLYRLVKQLSSPPAEKRR